MVFGCVCGWGALLVALDCGCGREVSRRLCGVLLVVFNGGFVWEVLCWEVAWRVPGGCKLRCCWWCVNGTCKKYTISCYLGSMLV